MADGRDTTGKSVRADWKGGVFLDAGYVPVVSVPMLAADGVPVNADADRAAAAVAGALDATLDVLEREDLAVHAQSSAATAGPNSRPSRFVTSAAPACWSVSR
jgi:thymidine phosphorylase